MRLSRSNQVFGLTGLVLAIIGGVYLLNGGIRTSTLQAIILLCSGSSLCLIASLNILINQISKLYYRYNNPMRNWSKGNATIFNFKG